ncbi:hypothetical protein C8D88_11676 [Lentzea atacamensis]|uniref:Uncharacterized protein n=1 Tax=Lentzea atacamensis TaxID=531938 RepID=A0A316HLT1_9PSEU|nr:hypothetical protein [Lentzea atacamensis]PWK81665.1 hypothetical protein C8D88_11676 [Lentzea atacamensis]
MSDDFLRYSEALDEIWRLRRLLAHEACIIEAHLGLKTFPRSRREIAEQQINRMRRAARGDAKAVHYDIDHRKLNYAMDVAGAPQTLTAAQFLTGAQVDNVVRLRAGGDSSGS